MPYADLPEPKYSVGQELWFADIVREISRLPCPDCRDTKAWKVETPAGQTYEVPCQRCCGGYTYTRQDDVMPLDYPVWKGVARLFVPTSVEVCSKQLGGEGPKVTYWSANGGRGEVHLFADEADALALAKIQAAERDAEEQAKPEFLALRNIGKLKIDDAKYDQFASGLWNAWYAYNSMIERLDEWIQEAKGDEREYVQALRDSIAWEIEYQQKQDRPLDALVDAVVAALAGDASHLQPAYNALPQALKRQPAPAAETELV